MTEQLCQQVNSYIVQIAKGNELALDKLSRAISGRMMSVAMSILHNYAWAQDALQDAFVKIVQKAHTFSPSTNGYAWVCKIVQNASLNVLRMEKRHRTVNIEDCFSIASGDDVFQTATQNVELTRAMGQLTKTEQVVVYQKYFMDYSLRDIAKSIGKSKSAVQRLILSAEEKLKNLLFSGTN